MIGDPVYLDSRGRVRLRPYEYRSHRDRRGRWWSKRRFLRVALGVAMSDTGMDGVTTVRVYGGSHGCEVTVPVYP